MAINIVCVRGNITRDADLYTTASGTAIVKFSLAINNRAKDKNGAWYDKPVFVNCTFFGKRAEAVQPRLTKGARVSVVGYLDSDTWKGKDGIEHKDLIIVVDDVDLPAKPVQTPQEPAYYPPAAEDAYGAEIPF